MKNNTEKKARKAYTKPAVTAQGNYAAVMSSCGKQVSFANSNCGW